MADHTSNSPGAREVVRVVRVIVYEAERQWITGQFGPTSPQKPDGVYALPECDPSRTLLEDGEHHRMTTMTIKTISDPSEIACILHEAGMDVRG